MLIAALWTVMASTLIRSVIGLALTSVILTVVMFRLNSPIAAIFELSVCAGLITAVFISAISMIKPLSNEEIAINNMSRSRRYSYLLVIIVTAGIALLYVKVPADFINLIAPVENDVRRIIWYVRQLDLIGQLAVLLVGIFAVKVLYMQVKKLFPHD